MLDYILELTWKGDTSYKKFVAEDYDSAYEYAELYVSEHDLWKELDFVDWSIYEEYLE